MARVFVSFYTWSAMVAPVMLWFVMGGVMAIVGCKWAALASVLSGLASMLGFREYYKHKNPVLILVREEDLPKIAKALGDEGC